MTARFLLSRNCSGSSRARHFLLALLVALALLASTAAMAQTQVSLQLITEGTGSQTPPSGYTYGTYAGGPNSYGGYYVYPYYMSVNGSHSLTPMLCDTFQTEVPSGSWQANVSTNYATYSTLANTMFSTQALYNEAAWLFHQLGTVPSQSTAAAINYAIWGLGDSALTSTTNYLNSGAVGEINSYKTALANGTAGNWSMTVYTPVNAGASQEFIAAATPVPEPGTLALMASGLVSTFGYIRRKKFF
jgi:hypothetical protein